MSLFQCENCGCVENTALASQGFKALADIYDWTRIEDRKGKRLCSACGPERFNDGNPTLHGLWHGKFERKFLPMGKFKTNRVGNLEHIESGSTDYNSYVLGSIKCHWCDEEAVPVEGKALPVNWGFVEDEDSFAPGGRGFWYACESCKEEDADGV